MSEQWRSIPGYEGRYEVSDQGAVRSVPRPRSRGGLLKPTVNPKGYLAVTLSEGGRSRRFSVHALVLLTFVGPRPEGQLSRHLDDVKLNNTLANLAYGTPSENEQDKVRNGGNPMAAKTECPRGHSYDDPGNLIIQPKGHRLCRTCQLDWKRRNRKPCRTVTCPDCTKVMGENNLSRHRRTHVRAALDGDT